LVILEHNGEKAFGDTYIFIYGKVRFSNKEDFPQIINMVKRGIDLKCGNFRGLVYRVHYRPDFFPVGIDYKNL